MISSTYKFIYLHTPKTGGNSIQDRLVAISDDQKELGGSRDGVDRFDLKGPVTAGKHQRLARYASAVPELSAYKIAISVRHPLERAVSFYFSPHRWVRKVSADESALSELRLDPSDFTQVLQRLSPIADFLTIDGRIHSPDFTIRFETLQEDFATFVTALELPVPSDLPHRNASAAGADIRTRAIEDPVIRSEVKRRYAADFELFGYTM